METVKFAPLYYHPGMVTEECYCVGVLFCNMTTGDRDFVHVKNYDRILKMYSKSDMEEQVKALRDDILNYEKYHLEPFDMEDFTDFVNLKLEFADIKEIKVDKNFDYKTYVSKLFMRYDFTKEERLSW